MSKRDDGGPAYPVQPFSTYARNWRDGAEGMTFRDHVMERVLPWCLNEAGSMNTATLMERFGTDYWQAAAVRMAYGIAQEAVAEKLRREGEQDPC